MEFNPYPEFEDYKLIGETMPIEEENKDQNIKAENFMAKVSIFLKKVQKNVRKAATVMKSKINNMELGEKIKYTGQKAFVVVKTAGGYVVEKGTPYLEKFQEKTAEGYEIMKEKTKNGASIVANKTKEAYIDIKSKYITKGEDKTLKINEKGHVVTDNLNQNAEIKENKDIINFIDEENKKNEIIDIEVLKRYNLNLILIVWKNKQIILTCIVFQKKLIIPTLFLKMNHKCLTVEKINPP